MHTDLRKGMYTIHKVYPQNSEALGSRRCWAATVFLPMKERVIKRWIFFNYIVTKKVQKQNSPFHRTKIAMISCNYFTATKTMNTSIAESGGVNGVFSEIRWPRLTSSMRAFPVLVQFIDPSWWHGGQNKQVTNTKILRNKEINNPWNIMSNIRKNKEGINIEMINW